MDYSPKNDPRVNELWPPCHYCEHRIRLGYLIAPYDGWTCKAFPDGIPRAILERQVEHDDAFPTQTGDFAYKSTVMRFHDGEFVVDFWGNWSRVDA